MKKTEKNKSGKKTKIYIFIAVMWLVIIAFAAAVMFVIFSGPKNDSKQPVLPATKDSPTVAQSLPETTAEPTKATQAETTEENTQQTATQKPAENSKQFTALIEKAGISAEELSFQQLVVVDSSSTSAVVNCFEKKNGVWTQAEGLASINGFVGRQGVSSDANENASYTPQGLFSIGTGFGIMDDPGTGLDYIKVKQDSYWVDDPNSKYYNQYVEGTADKDWSSAEHLISCSPDYNYCFFIEYNTNPVVPGKGSAFFMHVGSTSTAGCVAVSQGDMINILRWLKKSSQPHILIM